MPTVLMRSSGVQLTKYHSVCLITQDLYTEMGIECGMVAGFKSFCAREVRILPGLRT